jgi:hypothetical protein
MVETTSDILAATSAATSGNSTPNNVSVTRPTKESVWTLYGGIILSGGLAVLVIACLAWWVKWPEGVAGSRVNWLGIMGCMGSIGVPITIIALASSRIGQVKATAGDKTVEIDGRT